MSDAENGEVDPSQLEAMMLAAWTAADTENAQEEAAAQEQMHETAFSNAFAQQTHTSEHDFDETQAELARLLSEANPDFDFAAPVEADDDYSNLFNAATEFGQYEEYAAAAPNKSIFTPQQKKRKAIVQEDVIIDEEPAKKRRLEERGLSALISKVKGERDQEGRIIALPPVPEFWSYELEPMQDVREKQKVMKELAVVEGGDPEYTRKTGLKANEQKESYRKQYLSLSEELVKAQVEEKALKALRQLIMDQRSALQAKMNA